MVDVSQAVGGIVSDPVDIYGRAQSTLSLSTTAAQTAALSEGLYDVYCATSDVYVKVAQTANDVTTSTGYLVLQGNMVTLSVPANSKIGGILASGTATLIIHQVG